MGIYSNIIKRAELQKLNTPDRLFKWMNENMEYAYKTINGDVSYDFDHMYPDYRLQSPMETFNSKVGVCWDQALFEQYVFNNIIHKECKLYYIIQKDNNFEPTHTFIFFKDKENWYYFENSYERIRGIYKITDEFDTFDFIIENMRKEQKDLGVRVFEVNKDFTKYSDNFTKNTDIISFMDFCESCELIYTK